MARAVDAGQVTPADELRVLLTESEKLMANVRGLGAATVDLLRKLDRIGELWPELEAAGVDLRPEAGRWQTLQAQVQARGPAIVRELQAAGGLPALRGQGTPGGEGRGGEAGANTRGANTRPWASTTEAGRGNGDRAAAAPGAAADEPPGWWWHLDRLVAERRRQRLLRTLAITMSSVAVLLVAVLVFRRLFPVDPKVAAAVRSMSAGQSKIGNDQDYRGALADFQAAANATPNDPDAWLWVGATQQKLGQDSTPAFATARRLSPDELSYLLERGPIYTQVGLLDLGRADLNAALKLDPQNAQAWYYLATVEETQGNLSAAASDLEKSSTYADAHNDSQLVAMARVRLGLLIQRMQAGQYGDATPTP